MTKIRRDYQDSKLQGNPILPLDVHPYMINRFKRRRRGDEATGSARRDTRAPDNGISRENFRYASTRMCVIRTGGGRWVGWVERDQQFSTRKREEESERFESDANESLEPRCREGGGEEVSKNFCHLCFDIRAFGRKTRPSSTFEKSRYLQ